MSTDETTHDRAGESNGGDKGAANSRREFIASSAAVIGAGVALGAGTANAQQPGRNGAATTQADLQAPAGLGPRAMLDNRFAVTYENSVPMAIEVLIAYFAALSRRDLPAMADQLHFPFATFEGTDPVLVETRRQLLAKAPPSMNMHTNPQRFTDHDGYLKPGAYDVFEGVEVLCCDPVIVGIAMSYNRYGSDGKRLLRCEGVYSITNNDGRWAIQLMSTIFKPAHMVGVRFPDAEQAANRIRIDHDLAYQVSDRDVDNGGQIGPRASVSNIPGQPWSLGPNGRAMEQFRTKGIKTRLRYNPQIERPRREASANPAQDYAEYRALFPRSGVGEWGWVYGTLPETRMLHVTYDKVHTFSGAMRFTAAGEECSYNTNIGIVTYKKGRWGSAGNIAYTTPHDRSNDVLRG